MEKTRLVVAAVLLSMLLAGCISVSSSDPNAPANSAAARPAGTTGTCMQPC